MEFCSFTVAAINIDLEDYSTSAPCFLGPSLRWTFLTIPCQHPLTRCVGFPPSTSSQPLELGIFSGCDDRYVAD